MGEFAPNRDDVVHIPDAAGCAIVKVNVSAETSPLAKLVTKWKGKDRMEEQWLSAKARQLTCELNPTIIPTATLRHVTPISRENVRK